MQRPIESQFDLNRFEQELGRAIPLGRGRLLFSDGTLAVEGILQPRPEEPYELQRLVTTYWEKAAETAVTAFAKLRNQLHELTSDGGTPPPRPEAIDELKALRDDARFTLDRREEEREKLKELDPRKQEDLIREQVSTELQAANVDYKLKINEIVL